MTRLVKSLAPAALVAGLTVSVGVAQPPRGEKTPPPAEKTGRRPAEKTDRPAERPADRPAERPADRPADPRRGDPAGRPPAKLDPAAEAWVKSLIEKMNDPHDVIRDSARAGIVAAGREALPLLMPLAEGGDAKAVAARRLIERIQTGDRVGVRLVNQPADGRRPDGDPGRPAARPDGAPGRPDNPAGRPDNNPAGRPDGAPGDGPPVMRVLAQLDLTEKQQKEVRELMESVQQKMRGLGEQIREGKLERQDIPERVQKINMDAMAEMREILTKGQFDKLRESLPEGRPLFGPPPGRPGAPGERRPDNPPPGERRPERPRE